MSRILNFRDFVNNKVSLVSYMQPEWSKYIRAMFEAKLNHVKQDEFIGALGWGEIEVETIFIHLGSFNEALIEEITTSDITSFNRLKIPGSEVPITGFPIYLHRNDYYRQRALELFDRIKPPPRTEEFFKKYLDECISRRRSRQLLIQSSEEEHSLQWLQEQEKECLLLVNRYIHLMLTDENEKRQFVKLCSSFIDWLWKLDLQANKPSNYEHFEDVFVSKEAFSCFIDTLTTHNVIDRDTKYFIDSKSGKKAFLIMLLKDLHGKGYLKHTKPLSVQQIIHFSIDFFHFELKQSHIYKTQINSKQMEILPHWIE